MSGAVAGELVSPAAELVEVFVGTLERDTTKATYRSACGRFVAWLRDRHGPQVGPERLTLDELAAYQRQLAMERSPFTVRKERAALNGLLRFLLEHELVDPPQARLALAVQGPRPKDADGRRPVAALTERQYERLVGEGERAAARDPLLGWRDITIVRLLGECGLRTEELTRLERRDLRPVRRGAKRRELHVRHGKGARIRSVPIAGEALHVLRRWDRLRVERVGGPPDPPVEAERWPLVCTLGRRRRDRSLTDPGRVCGYDTIVGVVERLARRADVPEELGHPHVLRHTYATRYLRRTNDLAGLQQLLGHADIRTTMRYVHVAADELHERVERAFAGAAIALDTDAEA